MSYCVVCVVLYLYGSLPPVVCSVGRLMLYCVACFVLCCTCTDLYLQLFVVSEGSCRIVLFVLCCTCTDLYLQLFVV
jgi:hypothetical protein